MIVAHAMFPDEKLVAPAIGLYLLLAVILTLPYVKWRQRTQTREVAQ
jgi:hypothetical protein